MNKYSAQTKSDVLKYAKMHSLRKTARKFNVAHSTVHQWRKAEQENLKLQSEKPFSNNQDEDYSKEEFKEIPEYEEIPEPAKEIKEIKVEKKRSPINITINISIRG